MGFLSAAPTDPEAQYHQNIVALERRIADLERAGGRVSSSYVAVPTAWTAVSYTNSWVDSGGGLQAMQYRKVGDVVQIRGAMKNGTIGAVAFTLPTGFRPPAAHDLAVIGAAAAAGYYWGLATSGTITPQGASNTLSEVSGILEFSTVS